MTSVFIVAAGMMSTVVSEQAHAATVIDVTAAPYSAAGDGVTNDRVAIQDALDHAGAGGGATVLLPPGKTFLSGSLDLPSNVTLEIEGVLKQSQDPADYSFPVIMGHGMPDNGQCQGNACVWDMASLHNAPLVLAHDVHDVAVEGSGAIQLTQTAQDATSIGVVGIAMSGVDGFTVSGLTITGATNYNVAVYNSEHGTVSGMTILAPGVGNSDAIATMNAEHLRITGNTINVGDDAIYVGAWYNDPRDYASSLGGVRWWSLSDPHGSADVEIDHNDIKGTANHALAFLPWAASYPDQSAVEVSDIRIHDNTVGEAGVTGMVAIAEGCDCNDPYNAGKPWGPSGYSRQSPTLYQSPIQSVTFAHNTYNEGRFESISATDLKSDFPGGRGVSTVVNGDFAQGTAWWTATGNAGAATTSAHGPLNPRALRALARMGRRAGFIQGGAPAQLSEGLGLAGAAGSLHIPGVDFGTYDLAASVAASGSGAELFVHDTCSDSILGSTLIDSATPATHRLTFQVPSDCDAVDVGVRYTGAAQAGSWALVTGVTVTPDVDIIDNLDPSVTYDGSWGTFSAAGDWGGSHATAMADGASVSIPFTGARAYIIGQHDPSLGYEDVYLDGAKVAEVNTYGPQNVNPDVVFDTGPIPNGSHTLKIVRTGQKDAAASSAYIVFNAIVVVTPQSSP